MDILVKCAISCLLVVLFVFSDRHLETFTWDESVVKWQLWWGYQLGSYLTSVPATSLSWSSFDWLPGWGATKPIIGILTDNVVWFRLIFFLRKPTVLVKFITYRCITTRVSIGCFNETWPLSVWDPGPVVECSAAWHVLVHVEFICLMGEDGWVVVDIQNFNFNCHVRAIWRLTPVHCGNIQNILCDDLPIEVATNVQITYKTFIIILWKSLKFLNASAMLQRNMH